MSRVLVVEDDPDLVALVRHWLERDGHVVEHAADGVQGVETLRRDPLPQLVLLDVMLPKVDGFAVLKQIRLEPRTRDLPVVIVTSFSRDKDAVRGRKLGASDYVVKPLMELEFLRKIQRFIKA